MNNSETLKAIAELKVAIEERFEQERKETLDQVRSLIDKIGVEESNQTQYGHYELSKADRIGQYLNLLYEAQRADHSVHNEIDEALKMFRQEVGF